MCRKKEVITNGLDCSAYVDYRRNIVTEVMMNTHVRDNFLETAPAKATAAGDIFYATAANAITRLPKSTTVGDMLEQGASLPQWGQTELTRAKGDIDHKEEWHDHCMIEYSDCESGDGWANDDWAGTHAGTVANDTTTSHFKTGLQGISITTAVNNGGGHISHVKNLALFPDGSICSTADYWRLWLYITTAEINKMAADSCIRLDFYCDTVPTQTNFFYYRIEKATLVDGGTFYNIAKSACSSVGSPNWANVKGVALYYNSPGATTPTSAMTWTIDTIHICRKDPVGAYPNPFQRRINNVETVDNNISAGFWWIGLENGVLNWRNLNPSTTGTAATVSSLVGLKSYSTSFMAYMMQKIKTANSSAKLIWEIDANNRIMAYINTSALYLGVTTASVDDITTTTAYTCALDDVIEFVLVRNTTTVSLLVYKNGNRNSYMALTKEVNYSSVGYLSIGDIASVYANIKALSITTTDHAHHSDVAEVAETANSLSASSSTLTDIYALLYMGV